MENVFNVEIISPEKIIFSGKARMATLPSYEGDMSILKNHISIITFLRPGVIKIEKSEGNFSDFFVEDGTVEYFGDSLVLLSATVMSIKDLSKKFIDDLSENTKNKLNQKELTDHERYILNHKLDVLKEIRI
tara:strand:- start:824 stop:1219 length:396 start_codon:yes stop_codon:yes gene_type:complete